MSLLDKDGYITDPYRNFIAISRYARWDETLQRRETWEETVNRYMVFMRRYLEDKTGYCVGDEQYEYVKSAILNMRILPSLRSLMTSGPALEKSAIAAYNCAFLPVDSVKSFDEAMFILMCGTGVGFSVENQYVNSLPTIPEDLEQSEHMIVVPDSREGWAKSLRMLVSTLYSGQIPLFDVSKVRLAGQKLKTFGGRASGPEPLSQLFKFVVDIFINARGRKLSSLECHDIMCKIGEVVVAGSVRRSALISLSDLNDSEMAAAKDGQFWLFSPHRSMANNSAVYNGKPNVKVFLKEWNALIASNSGERGIFNIKANQDIAAKDGRRSKNIRYGTNPCSEIILRPYQFCNLSTVPVNGTETLEELKEKVELATIVGTWQSTITHFHYLKKEWKQNSEEERLLGVSLSGIFGHPVLNGSQGLEKTAEWLDELRLHARSVNENLAGQLGIAPSAAITCIKPEGNSSQLTNTSSGIHPWHSEYYIRTVRSDSKDPLGQFLRDSGIPCEPDLMKPEVSEVFSFPIKAPAGALTRKDLTALEHLELWLTYQRHYCEHKPSITVNVKDEEWLDVGKWVYDHFDEVSGISFLPYADHVYQQAPYQEVTEEEYNEALAKMPKELHWSLLAHYENDDEAVIGGRELACSAGQCEVVDLNS